MARRFPACSLLGCGEVALRPDGTAILSLYAAGSNGQGGIMIWGHGLHIAWAFVSGRLAGGHAAQREPA